MAMKTHVVTPRSDVVGSLLRPSYSRAMRQAVRGGRASTAELRAAEDRAVLGAIALQEAAGLDVITDGEYRRYSWIATIPIRKDRSYHAPLSGDQFIPADSGWYGLWHEPDGRRAQISVTSRPFITQPLRVERDIVTEEYSFLKANAQTRTKYTSRRRVGTASSGIWSIPERHTPHPKTSCTPSLIICGERWSRNSSPSAATTSSWMPPTTRGGTSTRTPAAQEAKLRLIGQVARRVWRT